MRMLRTMLWLGSTAAVMGLVLCGSAYAHVTSGANCANCHLDPGGSISVSGNTAAPTFLTVNPRLDAGSTSSLPTFTVSPGGTVAMTINVLSGGLSVGDQFAFALTGTPKSGTTESVTNTSVNGVKTTLADLLKFTPDAGWSTRTTGGLTYFYSGPLSWSGSTASKTFNLSVLGTTPADVYSLTLKSTGVDSSGNMWTQSQEVLLNVVATPEPATMALLGIGGVLTLVRRRWKWKG
jgi:hypothetical protein